ncbi:MAG: NAD(P)H-dependent oxidoreductase [Acidobacteriota bacterium]
MTDSAPAETPLFIPLILGTPRQGRASEHVARYVFRHFAAIGGVETELVDVREIPLPASDAGEAIKDPRFSELCMRADAFVLVTPEYNHGYPGILKHALDSNLKEYIHKAVGICGVSAGPFGGTRVIENLLPVLRELGLVTIFWDVAFSGVRKLFDASGAILDPAYEGRLRRFSNELVWMARVLRAGRVRVPLAG